LGGGAFGGGGGWGGWGVWGGGVVLSITCRTSSARPPKCSPAGHSQRRVSTPRLRSFFFFFPPPKKSENSIFLFFAGVGRCLLPARRSHGGRGAGDLLPPVHFPLQLSAQLWSIIPAGFMCGRASRAFRAVRKVRHFESGRVSAHPQARSPSANSAAIACISPSRNTACFPGLPARMTALQLSVLSTRIQVDHVANSTKRSMRALGIGLQVELDAFSCEQRLPTGQGRLRPRDGPLGQASRRFRSKPILEIARGPSLLQAQA